MSDEGVYIGSADIKEALMAIASVELLAPESREILSTRVRPVVEALITLRTQIKNFAAIHGVSGATGTRHPPFAEIADHVNAVMRGWMSRAGDRAAAAIGDRIASVRAELFTLIHRATLVADREQLAQLLQDATVALDGAIEEREPVVVPAVDRTATTTTDGRDAGAVRNEQRGGIGMHKSYIVLTDEERAKGFVRPVRNSYIHEKCGTLTRMGCAIAETYARDPSFYSATFCCGCNAHFPVGEHGEFIWSDGDKSKVGT